jgi:hypothetical protein
LQYAIPEQKSFIKGYDFLLWLKRNEIKNDNNHRSDFWWRWRL